MEIAIASLFGILFGSFLNVIILRVPNNESVVFTPSHCTSCNTNLKPWHNIPLLSWLFLGGKCSYCKAPISIQYPLIELTSGVIFAMLASKYGLSFPIFMIAMSFLMLLALSVIDLRYKMVPDSLNLLAILFAILGAWNIESLFQNISNAFLFAGAFTLLRFSLSYYLTSRYHNSVKKRQTSWNQNYDRLPFIEAMGEGDIMVAATMGALLGVPLTFVAIFFSALLALPILLFVQHKSKEEQKVPFVPFLALATFIVFMLDTPIMHYIKVNY